MVINPKQWAIEQMQPEAPVAVMDMPAQEAPDDAERAASEQKVAALMRDIQSLPDSNSKKAELMAKVQQAQGAAGGGIPDTNLVASIQKETDDVQSDMNAKEGQQIQKAAGQGILMIAGLSGLAHLSKLGLGPQVAPMGNILLRNHKEAHALGAGMFDDGDQKTIGVPSAGMDRLFDRGFVDPGSRVAMGQQPARGADVGAGPALPSRFS